MWAMMNVEQDRIEAQEKEIGFYRVLLNLIHSNPEKMSLLLSGQDQEEPVDPEFETDEAEYLWWGNADMSKGVEWDG